MDCTAKRSGCNDGSACGVIAARHIACVRFVYHQAGHLSQRLCWQVSAATVKICQQLTAACHLPGRHVPFWRPTKSQSRHTWLLLAGQTGASAVVVLFERSVPAAISATTEHWVSDPAWWHPVMRQRCLWHAGQPPCTAVASHRETAHLSEIIALGSPQRCARSQVQTQAGPGCSQELAMDTPEVQGSRLKGAGLP